MYNHYRNVLCGRYGMEDPVPIYHSSSMKEPLTDEELLAFGISYAPAIFSIVRERWLERIPRAPLRRMYGLWNEVEGLAAVVETSWKHPKTEREMLLAVSYTPSPSDNSPSGVSELYASSLISQYSLVTQNLV